MAQIPDFETRFCAVWNVDKKPSARGRWKISSSKFNLLDDVCYLTMRVRVDKISGNVYGIYLETDSEYIKNGFNVTTFIEEKMPGSLPLLPTSTIIESLKKCSCQNLWRFSSSEISRNIPEFLNGCEFKIVCLFHCLSDFVFQPKNKTACLAFTSSLDSLSVDISNMLEDKVFPDFKLHCGDRTVSAHRNVLAARSRFFADMFRNKMAESESGIIEITDMNPEILELFLKYLYSGKMPRLSEDTISSLYSAGVKYAVHALIKECCGLMLRNVNKENCLRFLILADTRSDNDFKDALINFMTGKLEVLDSEAWKLFNEEYPTLANNVYKLCFEEHFKQASQLKE